MNYEIALKLLISSDVPENSGYNAQIVGRINIWIILPCIDNVADIRTIVSHFSVDIKRNRKNYLCT